MQDAQIFPTVRDEDHLAQLVAQLKSGANWFYWIAALSFANSLLFVFGSDLGFPIGLGYTLVVDGITYVAVNNGAPTFVKGIGLVVNAGIVLVCAALGFLAGRGQGWAFVVAIGLYAVDGLLHIALGSFVSVGFHVFALIFIIRGYLACRKLSKLALETEPGPPPPPSVSLATPQP